MRGLLLWASRNRWLRDFLPRQPFVRRAVRRFMPGETADQALGAVARLNARGLGSLLTILGEDVADRAETDRVAEDYRSLIGEIARRGLDGEPSVKLSQLGLEIDAELTFAHLDALAAAAREAGTWLWLDMEGSATTDRTVELYARLREHHPNVGIAIQAYLRRTPGDVARLLPLGPGIRLVKGAYAEPHRIALHRRGDVDAALQSLAVMLLPHAATGQVRLVLGTHDLELVERVADFARALDVPVDRFEVHMLYGIRSRDQRRLVQRGFRVKTLVSYGTAWYPWYLRRLAERPANVVFALRSLFP
jgi:proline dehydrogenase